jgi:CheY-like chemotaxis protein
MRSVVFSAALKEIAVRILIVEDDRKLAEFVARGLRAERFAVDLAADGREGESYLGSYEYDLLVLDLMLPYLSGTELLRRVRQSHTPRCRSWCSPRAMRSTTRSCTSRPEPTIT